MIATIYEGCHYCVGVPPRLMLTPTSLVYQVTFHTDCAYSIAPEDQADINKLFGIGYFPSHHDNSMRFGWRYIIETGKMEIMAYWYENKVRNWDSLCMVDIGKTYLYGMFVMEDKCRLIVSSDGNNLADRTYPLKRKWIGYFLRPYFGGNQTAPHKMTIELC